MPDLNDFHAFKSTGGGSGGGSGGGDWGWLKPLLIIGLVYIVIRILAECA